MGDLQSLSTARAPALIPLQRPQVTGRLTDNTHCALCGVPLNVRALHYHVLSPYATAVRMRVCPTCRRVAFGAGYRPVA